MQLVVFGAGLAARRAGADAVVLEARNRIGGRTWMVPLGPGSIDLGGAWVHDSVGNPVAESLSAAGIGARNDGPYSPNGPPVGRLGRRGRLDRDPYARGSYSYIPVGATVDDMKSLAEPISDRVCLAGEATVLASYATVHAAFASGLRAAGHVLGKRPERLSLCAVPAHWPDR
ncbi:MAG: FAD-dependent oxidoreductase [Solirubrobacterales bacterium]